jgi:carbonic anhydrase/acetyltransferase-like protein (isoleucine patch superfamily)
MNMKAEKHFKLRDDLKITFNEVTLYRIEALRDIPTHDIKTGDIGGYVEKEENLSDNAWVFDDAKVFGNAMVFGNAAVSGRSLVYGCARIFGRSVVCGNSFICGDARIYGHSKVYDNAQVTGKSQVSDHASVFEFGRVIGAAQVYGNARVFGDALVCDYSHVFGDAEVSNNGHVSGRSVVSGGEIKSPMDSRNITGDKYNITILPYLIQIGCQCHTKDAWWRFTDEEIFAMDGRDGLKWWRKWKPILMAICVEDEKGE